MKAIKYLIYLFLFIAAIVIISSFVIVRFYGDDIKTYVVKELNKNLLAKVDVKEVEFKLLTSFPLASVEFSEVVIYSSLNENDTMLHAQKLACHFSLKDLYEKKYELKEIIIQKGACNLEIDKIGNENYIFWKSTDSASTSFKVNLQEVDIRDFSFSYTDHSIDFNTSFFIEKTLSKGSFTDTEIALEINTKLLDANLTSGSFNAFKNRTLFINATGTIDQVADILVLNDVNIGVEALNFQVSGKVDYKEETNLDLSITSKDADLEKALSILPESIRKDLTDYSIKGEASIKGSISGNASAISNPSYQFNFSINNGSFKKKNSTIIFSESFLKGKISNGAENKLSSTLIEAEQFETKLNQSSIKGSLSIKNLLKPEYIFNGSVDFLLKDALDFFEAKDIENGNGKIQSNLSLTGKLEQFEKYTLADFKKSTLKGQVNLENVSLDLPKESLQISNTNGLLTLQNSNFELDKFSSSINENIIHVKGKLYNIVPFILSDKEELISDLVLSSDHINLNSLIAESKSSDSVPFKFPSRLNIYLETKFKSLSYNTLQVNSLNGDIMMKDGRLDFRNLQFFSQGGEINGDFFLHEKNDNLSFYANSKLLNIDINTVFSSFKNFNQKTITSNNISGSSTSDLNLSFSMDRYFNLKLASLKLDADIIIDSGRLKNVKALEALSKFIELDELKDIQFKTLRNQLSIQDCTLTIPKFEIQSSALNLSVEGRHKFNNTLDYHFVILLNEILGNKVKKPKSNEFGYIEDDGLGRTKLFMKLYGTTEHPEFGYDTEELKMHLKTEVDQEKKTIKQLLKDEFGFFKKDTTLNGIETKPKETKNPFKIEWEEGKKEKSSEEKKVDEKKNEKKGKFGKFIDKIAKPNEDEFVEPIEN